MTSQTIHPNILRAFIQHNYEIDPELLLEIKGSPTYLTYTKLLMQEHLHLARVPDHGKGLYEKLGSLNPKCFTRKCLIKIASLPPEKYTREVCAFINETSMPPERLSFFLSALQHEPAPPQDQMALKKLYMSKIIDGLSMCQKNSIAPLRERLEHTNTNVELDHYSETLLKMHAIAKSIKDKINHLNLQNPIPASRSNKVAKALEQALKNLPADQLETILAKDTPEKKAVAHALNSRTTFLCLGDTSTYKQFKAEHQTVMTRANTRKVMPFSFY